jgi:hypothetical protein
VDELHTKLVECDLSEAVEHLPARAVCRVFPDFFAMWPAVKIIKSLINISSISNLLIKFSVTAPLPAVAVLAYLSCGNLRPGIEPERRCLYCSRLGWRMNRKAIAACGAPGLDQDPGMTNSRTNLRRFARQTSAVTNRSPLRYGVQLVAHNGASTCPRWRLISRSASAIWEASL